MPSDRTVEGALIDIVHNITLAQRFTEGMTLAAFSTSDLNFYATMRAIEIISEASRASPQDVRDRHPHLPWRQIADVGNAYRHGYETIDHVKVWATVQYGLPPLLEAVSAELAALERAAPKARGTDAGDDLIGSSGHASKQEGDHDGSGRGHRSLNRI